MRKCSTPFSWARITSTSITASGAPAIISQAAQANCNYAELLAVARAMPKSRFVIACRAQDVHGPIPANVDVRNDAYGEVFDRLVLGAKAVLLPLADRNVMSGQLVCMQAFAAGKVVLTTCNNFIADWIAEAASLPFLRLYDQPKDAPKLLPR